MRISKSVSLAVSSQQLFSSKIFKGSIGFCLIPLKPDTPPPNNGARQLLYDIKTLDTVRQLAMQKECWGSK